MPAKWSLVISRSVRRAPPARVGTPSRPPRRVQPHHRTARPATLLRRPGDAHGRSPHPTQLADPLTMQPLNSPLDLRVLPDTAQSRHGSNEHSRTNRGQPSQIRRSVGKSRSASDHGVTIATASPRPSPPTCRRGEHRRSMMGHLDERRRRMGLRVLENASHPLSGLSEQSRSAGEQHHDLSDRADAATNPPWVLWSPESSRERHLRLRCGLDQREDAALNRIFGRRKRHELRGVSGGTRIQR